MLKVKEITKNETAQRHASETHARNECYCKYLKNKERNTEKRHSHRQTAVITKQLHEKKN